MIQISEHFTSTELGLDQGTFQQIQNARFLCEEVMEPIRAFYNAPINVHDGYRNPTHNAEVGGVPCSYHGYIEGRAAIDFDVKGHTYIEVFDWIRLHSHLPIDKIILEKNENEIPVTLHIQTDLLMKNRQKAYIGYTGRVEANLKVKKYDEVQFNKV